MDHEIVASPLQFSDAVKQFLSKRENMKAELLEGLVMNR